MFPVPIRILVDVISQAVSVRKLGWSFSFVRKVGPHFSHPCPIGSLCRAAIQETAAPALPPVVDSGGIWDTGTVFSKGVYSFPTAVSSRCSCHCLLSGARLTH